MDSLRQLMECGQSYWMDNLTRGMIQDGSLKKRVADQGLRGITSNPNTFNNAISESDDYDAEIVELKESGSFKEVYDRLAVTDVRNACDALRPVYDQSEGIDGFVSLEVSPYLAHDAAGTMEEARRLFGMVARPNVFIKIPGTQAGIAAIEQMLYEGIPINITLLFSIQRYEQVAQAYITAIEKRAAEGKAVTRPASVASFFLSRIDVLVDRLLQHRIHPGMKQPRAEELIGEAAIANAKLAYQSFKRIFRTDRWTALEKKGARVQRPLWASTGTKDPNYSDVRYIEPLIGPDTVNTMPEMTLAAFTDHGRVRENSVEEGLEEAGRVIAQLSEIGIDFNCVTWQLANEGIQKFIDPFDAVMDSLRNKCNRLTEKKRSTDNPGGHYENPGGHR